MNKERSFLKSFPVNGHPTKDEITLAFHAFSEQGERYCKVIVINENLPEFIFKYNRGSWQLRNDKNIPTWFNKVEIGLYLNDFLINK